MTTGQKHQLNLTPQFLALLLSWPGLVCTPRQGRPWRNYAPEMYEPFTTLSADKFLYKVNAFASTSGRPTSVMFLI
jgi:hypothetical protein